MSQDAALLAAMDRNLIPPTLRFYGWSAPAVSLGRHQDRSDINEAACRDAGIEIVRRVTGGRAVLHYQELTYALVAPLAFTPFSRGLISSYRCLNHIFYNVLMKLGATAQEAGPQRRDSAVTANCFAEPAAWELIFQGKKVIGSAQRRTARALLQHGSILIAFDAELNARIFSRGAAEEVERLAQKYNRHISGLDRLLGYSPDPIVLAHEIKAEMEREFKIRCIPG